MDYVIVPVTAGEMTIVAPNGERTKARLAAGKSYFRKAGVQHDVLNETAAEIVFLEVELSPDHLWPRVPGCFRARLYGPGIIRQFLTDPGWSRPVCTGTAELPPIRRS
jgi:hypothetical protein